MANLRQWLPTAQSAGACVVVAICSLLEPVSHGNTVLTRPWCGAVHTKVHTSVSAFNPFSGKIIDRHITPKKVI